jgi:hypothetical protein
LDQGVSISVNVERVPTPTRSMVATITAVNREGPQLSIVFGQAAPGARKLSAAVVITIAVRHAQNTLDNEEFRRRLFDWANSEEIVPMS